MNREKIAPGLILIGIGLLFLLRNMGVIHWWTMGSLLRFWPLVLVVVGINIIFHNHPVITTITWVAFFAIVVGFAITNPTQPPWNRMIGTPWNNVVHMNTSESVDLSVPMEPNLEKALLKLNTGAMKLKMEATDQELLVVKDFPFNPELRLNDKDNGRQKEISLSTSSVNFIGPNDEYRESLIQVNKNVVWSLEAKLGAAASEMDLREVPFERINMEVGAGDFRLKLSQTDMDSQVNINAGASQVVLELPRDINARITAKNVLSQTSIDGRYWNQQGDEYTSMAFDPRKPVMEIDIKMGVGRLEIISR